MVLDQSCAYVITTQWFDKTLDLNHATLSETNDTNSRVIVIYIHG